MSRIADRGSHEISGPTQNPHEQDLGLSDRTLVGESTAKKYDDAVGFVSEGEVVSTSMDVVKENNILLSHIHPSHEPQHTIKKILSRPVKIATIVYDTNTAAGGQLATYDIMRTFRNNAGFALGREKLSTFYGVNWRAHLKVTLNAQPFESGLFQIFFQPFQRTIGSQIPATTPAINTIPFATGCPNVLCNIALQSEVELSVPYSGPIPFINLTNDSMDFGNFTIQTIVPIADSTNNASCELSVYMFFSEIELFGTTPCNRVTIATPQGLGKTQNSEAQAKTHGPIGGLIQNVSRVGNSLIPLLDMIGLSAPTTDLNPPRRHIDPYSSPSTADTVKSPLKVSYLSTQAVEIGQLGVDKQDECDILHIIEKPTYYDQFSWSVTNDAPAVLNTYPVEPNVASSFQVGNNFYVSPTRLRYMSNIFKYWRGTMKFTFHVIANKFHSGRLRFVYTLGGGLQGTGQTPLENFPRSFTQVVDIRDATTFEVECEYFGTAPWRVVPQQLGQAGYVGDANITGPLGDIPATLTVCVENELRAATTTSQSIQIVCMVSGGRDFEFSTPIAASSLPIEVIPAATRRVANPQSLSYQSLSMVGEDQDEPQKNPSPFTTGEEIKNVRTLLRRYQLIASGTNTLTAGNPNVDYLLLPYYVTAPTPANVTTLFYEMLCYFRKLFYFYRGGMRYLLTTSDDDYQFTVRYNADISQAQPIATAQPFGPTGVYQISAWPAGTSLVTYPLTSTIPYLTKLQGGIELEFPYYSRYHKSFSLSMTRVSADDYESATRSGFIPNGIGYIQMTSKPSSYTNPAFVRLYRTVADDFNFGYLLGAPIVTPRVIN